MTRILAVAAALALGGCSLFGDKPADVVLVTAEPDPAYIPADCNPKGDPKYTPLPKAGDIVLSTASDLDHRNAGAASRTSAKRVRCFDGLKSQQKG